jgi:tetratricopeptide (TPR) repeat protein
MVYQYSGLGFCHLFLGHADQAVEFFRKARAANPRIYYIHLALAAALGLRGDIDDAKASLSDFFNLKPDIRSLAKLRADRLFGSDNSKYLALSEKTVFVGLRRAGMPED